MEAPTPSSTELLEAPLVVVSCDSHIGPTLDQ
ncbi:MAG: hypothetical protein JWL73_2028, partial [Actinomycetia bacterium]|nr:hypothetical protein [Actinomycetes bacterium]